MENKEQQGGMCMGGMCDRREGEDRRGACTGCQKMYGMHCGGRYYHMRWILGILIIVFIFLAGIKVGEFKEGMRNSGYGTNRGSYATQERYNMMQRGGGINSGAYYRGGMMSGAGEGVPMMFVR
ncbi:MAG: hypothetical protein ACD_81C00054G0004 [uncultured bacterium]|uniref:Uncharacterized protein n=1 Tax=Candidatus Wolfebacteria bacterium GW2011_GWE2_44_13 TaxID=1619017 RepID=A0A0G1H8Y2_9BACT|nr:MAG: hypothetical protein ACD_81C00054G0004 [uncultured bacterium]KKT42958.1 MAG: hypothetical protein UW32_C0003G0061 [Candidatus Wolfebacteria bacterium GW2011_GWE2_44_13]